MPGVNLSQSMDEEEKSEQRSFFDTGIILSLLVVLITGLSWGGMRLYIGSIDKQIVEFDQTFATATGQLRGDRVDRIADFDARLNYFFANKDEFSDAQEVIQKLEKGVVSGVVLTRFEYNPGEKAVVFEGTCGDFRQLAEQVMSFKREAIFSQVKVEKVDRDKENQVVFSLKANL